MILKKAKTIILSFLIMILVISCNLNPETIYRLPPELANTLEPWQGDIYFLEHELPKRHKNVYHSISKEEYQNKIEILKEECTNLDSEQRVVKLKEFTALIRDAHTSYNSDMNEAYPLNLVVLEDGIFVSAALSENKELVRTTNSNSPTSRVKLIAINGIPISSDSQENTIFNIMKKILSHENDYFINSLLPASLLDPKLLYGAGITNSKTNCNMTFQFSDNSTKTINLIAKSLENFKNLDWCVYYDDNYPADRSKLPLYLQYSRENYYGSYFEEENLLYILYNSCKNDDNQSFSNFINEQYAKTNNKPIEKVVIDLRNNSGGDSRIIKPFYNLLNNQLANSKLYIIIGEKTFSSALMNAIELSKKYGGTLIGSPTGGKPNHYGEVKTIELPTGNRISYSTNYFKMIDNYTLDSLYPDISIKINSTDFFNLEDTVLNYIIQN